MKTKDLKKHNNWNKAIKEYAESNGLIIEILDDELGNKEDYYGNVDCLDCIKCDKCNNCIECMNCKNCNNLICCNNLKFKSYCIDNIQLTKEEYLKKFKELIKSEIKGEIYLKGVEKDGRN